MTPAGYVKHNCYVTCEADESDISPSLKEIGEDHIYLDGLRLSALRFGVTAHRSQNPRANGSGGKAKR